MYKHPGVYIEHVPSGALAIEAASTSITAFIGPVPRGPVDTPVFIVNRDQFAQQFGELDDETSGIRDLGDAPDLFGHAVNAFFDNGGGQAYILRVADGAADSATGALADPDAMGAKGFYFTALSPGAWGNKLVAQIAPVDGSAPDLGQTLEIGFTTREDDGSLGFTALESFSGLSGDPDNGAYLPKVVKARSALVSCDHLDLGGASGGAQVTALKSGDLRGLNVNDLKNKVMDLTINGVAVKVKFLANLTDIEVTRDVGGDDDLETHSAAAAMSDLDAVASELRAAVIAHGELAGFGAYVSHDAELVLVPPAVPDNSPTSVAVTGGGAATALRIDGANSSPVDFPAVGSASFIGGADGGAVGANDYDTALKNLRDYRNASILVLPGMTWDGAIGSDTLNKAITHAEFMKNRVVLVDPTDLGASQTTQLTDPKKVKDQGFPTSTFSALYYPWLEVTNPHYDADTRANRPQTHVIPPSGFAAGLWARTDGSRGVWKAPAGLEATVRGTRGPNVLIGNDVQDQLNEWGVNCIRNIIGPPVLWGARTLATKTRPDQRYVPVRRTSAMIGESLYNALQAVVFEPNKHVLWAALRASTTDFMDGLFRAGAFQGEKASDAYYVRCGLGSTMTQADIDAGIVRLVVGYAPLKPAEFVVVQIKQIVGQRG